MSAPHLVRTEAIVLRRHDLGEADRIITLYTLHQGKVRAVAKGVRRPTSKLAGHLELFTHSQIMLARGRNLDVITQADIVSPFLGLREDLWRAGHAYCAAELLDRLTEERLENQAVFRLLAVTLDRISVARRPDQAVRFFEMQLFALLGYRPELRDCVRCRQPIEPGNTSFSAGDGGVLCGSCAALAPQASPLSPNGVKILRLYQQGDWATVNRLRLDAAITEEVERLLREYAQQIVESRLKSTAFIASLREQGLPGGSRESVR